MKYFAGLILSLISFGVMAEAITLPQCIINNQPVAYQSLKAEHLNAYSLERWVAEAGRDQGYPVIRYNSKTLSEKPKEWSLHVLLHECGHFKLNHGLEPFYSKESDADCYGATVLRNEYGYTDEQFDIIIVTMRDLVSSNRVKAFKRCIGR